MRAPGRSAPRRRDRPAHVVADDRRGEAADERRALADEVADRLRLACRLQLASGEAVRPRHRVVLEGAEMFERQHQRDCAVVVALVELLRVLPRAALALGRHQALVKVRGREDELDRARPALLRQRRHVLGHREHRGRAVVPDRAHAVGVALTTSRSSDMPGSVATSVLVGAGPRVALSSIVADWPSSCLQAGALVDADLHGGDLPVDSLVRRVVIAHLLAREAVHEHDPRRARVRRRLRSAMRWR